MNQEVQAEWLAALKSGAYAKGDGYLREDDKYCCLGVLCDLYGKKYDIQWKPSKHRKTVFAFGTDICFLPGKVAEWAGLDGSIGEGSQSDLASVNDDSDTFEPVIDLIETL